MGPDLDTRVEILEKTVTELQQLVIRERKASLLKEALAFVDENKYLVLAIGLWLVARILEE